MDPMLVVKSSIKYLDAIHESMVVKNTSVVEAKSKYLCWCYVIALRTVSLIVPRMKTEEIARQMLPLLSQDTALCTDAYRGFKIVTKSSGIQHIALNQNNVERSRGVYHIQNVNVYHSRLKGLMEHFKGVSTKYLDNYMTWFAYIDTTRSISRGIWEQRFLAMSCIDSKKVRYKASVPTGTCVICYEPILKGQDIGSVFFVSHDTGERELDSCVIAITFISLEKHLPERVNYVCN
jgi:hypothetical protein